MCRKIYFVGMILLYCTVGMSEVEVEVMSNFDQILSICT